MTWKYCILICYIQFFDYQVFYIFSLWQEEQLTHIELQLKLTARRLSELKNINRVKYRLKETEPRARLAKVSYFITYVIN